MIEKVGKPELDNLVLVSILVARFEVSDFKLQNAVAPFFKFFVWQKVLVARFENSNFRCHFLTFDCVT